MLLTITNGGDNVYLQRDFGKC